MESATEIAVPTISMLRGLFAQNPQGGADISYAQMRIDTGNAPDPSDPAHAGRLREWLNQWGCRMGYPRPGDADLFGQSVKSWWGEWGSILPPASIGISELDDLQIRQLAAAFAALRDLPAYRTTSGVVHHVGPTATSKLLFALRPLAVPAWDNKIAMRVADALDGQAFERYLHLARTWVIALLSEAGCKEEELPVLVGRQNSTSPKLIDEYLYLTVSRKH